MNLTKTGIPLILCCLCSFCFSQNNYVRLDQIQGVPMTITYNLNEEKNVVGSRYSDDDWKEIRVERIDGINILIPEGKLDLYLNEIIVKSSTGAYILDQKDQIQSFTLGNSRYVTSFYANGLFAYFEELYKGTNVILYKKETCVIQKGKSSNGITSGTPDKFVKAQDFFVKKISENSEALKLKVTKKKVLLKNSNLPELSLFLDKAKVGYSSDQELIELFRRYDKN